VPSAEYRVPSTEEAGRPTWPLYATPAPRTRYSVLGTYHHSHDVHVSHTRLVLEGTTIAIRVRLFHDDLTQALQRFAGRSDLAITPEARADSVFGAYFARVVKLEADGRPLSLTVSSSAMERDDAAQDVVWYVLEGTVLRPPTRLKILHALLFETYGDQQNIVQLLRLPEDQRRTLYFTAGDAREQVVVY
jgi:hypothetical protein